MGQKIIPMKNTNRKSEDDKKRNDKKRDRNANDYSKERAAKRAEY